MMQCPVCGTTYTDTTLKYCLTDRATLVPIEQETVIRSAPVDPLRVDISPPSGSRPNQTAVAADKKNFPIVKVLLAAAATGLIVVAGVVIIAAVIYFNASGSLSDRNTGGNGKQTSTNVSPTVDPERQRLDDQIANLQKQIDQQANANRKSSTPAFPTPEPSVSGIVTARVNSPGDGFLAMRSEPSSDYGERVAKIPHGAIVNIENCEREHVRIGSRTGRWCMVTWGDHTGWVFDAWLTY